MGFGAASLAISKHNAFSIENIKNNRPNILFIMSDDHAANGISAYRGFLSEVARTPNIDRIAKEGILFRNCFCTNSICTPSRATILTGKYGHKNGCPHLDGRFDGSQQTFPKFLQQAGYYTSVIGKWHLATEPTGFDYYNVLPGQGDYFNPKFKEKGHPWKDGFQGGRVIKNGYVTDIVTDIALDCIEKRPKDKPFCILLHHKAPHDLWEYDKKHTHLYQDDLPEPDNLLDDYKTRKSLSENPEFKLTEGLNRELAEVHRTVKNDIHTVYQLFIKSFLRCVASIDENIGRLLNYLDKNHLVKNTIVIYTSDQGAFLGEHGLWDKRYMYEESIRMPFIVRFPKEVKAGTANDDIIINTDFAPTFLDYAGVTVPNDMQGRSIRPLLRGENPKDWRISMYYHYSDGGIPNHYGIRTERYKLIFFYGADKREWELFDLQNDPQEMNNVYNNPAYDYIGKELKADLVKLRKELGDEDKNYRYLGRIDAKSIDKTKSMEWVVVPIKKRFL